MHLSCIIHERHHEEYSAIKTISGVNEVRIREAKCLHEVSENVQRKKQCQLIPSTIDHEKHGIHLAPCYKNFTKIISRTQGSQSSSNERRSSERLSSPSTLFPKECKFCGKLRIKHGGRHMYPITVTTIEACETIKAYGQTKNPAMFAEIHDIDLIAKEFKFHCNCYSKYTYGFSSSFRESFSPSCSVSASTPNSDPADRESNPQSNNFNAVTEYIKCNILMSRQAVSIKVLHGIYGGDVNDTRYRAKLKKRILAEFPETLIFFQPRHNIPEVVISVDAALNEGLHSADKYECIRRASEFLKHDILEFAKQLPDLSWPPTIDELTSNERNPPESLVTFLQNLLKERDHSVWRSNSIPKLIDSYAADLVFWVTRGKVMTAKHFLLALGLHNLTGSRKVVEINSKLGHCIDYNLVCDIETAQANKAKVMASRTSILPLKPRSEKYLVNTWFWVDNFNENVETANGGGAVSKEYYKTSVVTHT